MTLFDDTINELGTERRPDRDEDKEWLHQIAAEVESLMPEREARREYALSRVLAWEARQVRKGNRLLREVGKTRQWPLDWLELIRTPIVVGKEHVALGAANRGDLQTFEMEQRRRAASSFAAQNETCNAALWFADLLPNDSAILRDLNPELGSTMEVPDEDDDGE